MLHTPILIHISRSFKNKERVCTLIANGFIEPSKSVWAQFKENGAKVVKGQIIYTLNGGEKSEEWYLNSAEIKKDRLIGKLPKGTTHYIFNFVDENNFLISYPDIPDILEASKHKGKGQFSRYALKN